MTLRLRPESHAERSAEGGESKHSQGVAQRDCIPKIQYLILETALAQWDLQMNTLVEKKQSEWNGDSLSAEAAKKMGADRYAPNSPGSCRISHAELCPTVHAMMKRRGSRRPQMKI